MNERQRNLEDDINKAAKDADVTIRSIRHNADSTLVMLETGDADDLVDALELLGLEAEVIDQYHVEVWE